MLKTRKDLRNKIIDDFRQLKIFAKKMGVNQMTLIVWLQGKNMPRKQRIIKMSELLGVDYKTLVHIFYEIDA